MFLIVVFKSASVYYERHEGKSNYSLTKMLAFDGITSLSIKLLSIISGFESELVK